MRRTQIISLIVLFLVSTVTLPAVVKAIEAEGGGTAGGAKIADMIRNAKTAEDHLKIAEHFEKQAKEAEERANDSAAFARCYHDTRRLSTRYAAPARNECILQQNEYRRIAAEDRKLAKIHREIAAELPKEGKK